MVESGALSLTHLYYVYIVAEYIKKPAKSKDSPVLFNLPAFYFFPESRHEIIER